jgi:hypothetical protein
VSLICSVSNIFAYLFYVGAADIYYRDEIGNISTSAITYNSDSVGLQVRRSRALSMSGSCRRLCDETVDAALRAVWRLARRVLRRLQPAAWLRVAGNPIRFLSCIVFVFLKNNALPFCLFTARHS